MKRITFICILATAIIAGCNPKKHSEKTILGMGTEYYICPETMNGRVKEVKEQNYWAIEKDGKMIKGDLLTWKELDSIGSTKNFVAYFDSSGVVKRSDRLNDDNTPRYSNFGTFENGKMIKWESKLKDSIFSYWIPQYDDLGYYSGGSLYRPINDTLISKQVFTHDGKGNYTKFEFFNPQGHRTGYNISTLDSEGRVIESKSFNKNDSLVSTISYGYNENGSQIRLDAYFNKSIQKWVMNDITIDDHGNFLEKLCLIDDGKNKYRIIMGRTYIYY